MRGKSVCGMRENGWIPMAKSARNILYIFIIVVSGQHGVIFISKAQKNLMNVGRGPKCPNIIFRE